MAFKTYQGVVPGCQYGLPAACVPAAEGGLATLGRDGGERRRAVGDEAWITRGERRELRSDFSGAIVPLVARGGRNAQVNHLYLRAGGRLAQAESACLTRKRPQAQILWRPPDASRAN